MKIEITLEQAQQFNLMRNVLVKIASMYQTPEELRDSCMNELGLDYEEALEMAYENIQEDASNCLSGIKLLDMGNRKIS